MCLHQKMMFLAKTDSKNYLIFRSISEDKDLIYHFLYYRSLCLRSVTFKSEIKSENVFESTLGKLFF